MSEVHILHKHTGKEAMPFIYKNDSHMVKTHKTTIRVQVNVYEHDMHLLIERHISILNNCGNICIPVC